MSNQKENAVCSTLWKFLERASSHGIKLLVQIILARILAPNDFGTISIILVFIEIATTFAQSGLNTALIQNRKVNDDDFSTVAWLSILMSAVLYLLLYILAPIIANFYENTLICVYLRVLGLMLFGSAFYSIQIAYASRQSQFKKQFKANFISVLISGFISVVMAYEGWGIWSLVAQQMIWQYVNCFVLGFIINWKIKFVFKKDRVRELFSFGWKMLLSSLLIRMNSMISRLIIGKRFSTSDLGFYTKASGFPIAFSDVAVNAISSVALVSFSNLQNDTISTKRALSGYVRFSFFFLAPMMFGLAAVSKPLILTLLTEKWLPCEIFLKILCGIYLFQPLCAFYGQAVSGLGRSDLYLRVFTIIKPLGLVLMLVLVYVVDDLIWFAILEVSLSALESLLQSRNVKKLINYDYMNQFMDWFPTILSAGLMYGSITIADSFLTFSNPAVLMVDIFVGMISYFLFAFIFQRNTFLQIINKIRMNLSKGILK